MLLAPMTLATICLIIGLVACGDSVKIDLAPPTNHPEPANLSRFWENPNLDSGIDRDFALILQPDLRLDNHRLQQKLGSRGLKLLTVLPPRVVVVRSSVQTVTTWPNDILVAAIPIDTLDQEKIDRSPAETRAALAALAASASPEAAPPGAFDTVLDEPFEHEPAVAEDNAPPTLDFLSPLNDVGQPPGAAAVDTSRFLAGSVAVGIFLPESNGNVDLNTENWTADEVASVMGRVQTATSFLAAEEPLADVSFVLHLENKPASGGTYGTVDSDFEGIRQVQLSGGKNFPDLLLQDVLSKVGPPGGFTQGTTLQRLRAYANWLRTSYNTNWSVVLVIIDNTEAQGGRASAYIHGPAINVFSNGPASTILHELGHTFGALDEYHPDAAKSANLLAGITEVTNANTQYDNGLGAVSGHGESIPSLMLSNVSYVNPYTRGAWGWYDSDHDGILDLFDAPPRITFSGPPQGTGPWTVTGQISVTPFIPQGSSPAPPITLDAIRDVRWQIRALGQSGKENVWLPLPASDSAWDEAVENFLLVIPPLPPGNYQISVKAQTGAGLDTTLIYPHTLLILPGAGATAAVFADFVVPTVWSVEKPLLLSGGTTTIFGNTDSVSYRWDIDSDGLPETSWSENPEISWVFDSPGTVNPTLFVSVNGTIHSATRTLEIIAGPPPPEARFIATPATTVGAQKTVEVLFQPLAPLDTGLLGRWDVDGDGTFETDWAPLAPYVHTYPIPDMRLELSPGTPTPGGRVYKSILLHNGWGFALDADREQLYAVEIGPEATTTIRSSVTVPQITIHSEMVPDGDTLIVSRGASGLVRIDVSDPTKGLLVIGPVAPGATTMAHGIVNAKGHLLVADKDGLTVIDPTETGQLVAHLPHSAPGQVVDVDVFGDLVCAVVRHDDDLYAGTLVVYDISNITTPVRRGELHLATANGILSWSTPTSVDAANGLCFVADVWSGARIVDVTNPDEPTLLTTLDVDGAVWDTQLRDDGLLFVASVYQLHVFAMNDPAQPQLLTDLALRFPRGIVFADDGTIHFAGSRNGYQIGQLIIDEPFRSKVWTAKLQVMADGVTAQSSRNIWAVSYGAPPQAKLNVSAVGYQVQLDASGSFDPDKNTTWDGLLRYRWDFDGDGAFDTGFVDNSQATTSFLTPGRHTVSVEVRDRFWGVGSATTSVCIADTTGGLADERCGDNLDNDCDGDVDEGQESLGAACSLGVGDCQTAGMWVCDPKSGKVLCGVPENTLTPEVCGDGLDNDCNGMVDDGFADEGAPCTKGLGECTQTGVWTCPTGGAWQLECDVTPKEPSAEVCNGKDDDCDGEVDENIVMLLPCDGVDIDNCATGTWICDNGVSLCEEVLGQTLQELCDGKDNDCDGMVDEGFSSKNLDCDGPDPDKCRFGKWVCLPDGKALECVEIGPGLAELCNGVDDDCDKVVDQNFPDVGLPCDGPDIDFCKTGTGVCAPDGQSMVCEEQAPAFVETCNGKDDDCDGFVDEDFGPVGELCDGPDKDMCKTGTWVCQTESLSTCNEPEKGGWVELCNYVDDDCDGEVDEGFDGLGLPCDGPDEDKCVSGWLGCSADLETTVCHETGGTSYEICNGIDDDCDLDIDEDFPVGTPCDGPDIDFCKNGVFGCSPSGEQVVCGGESIVHIVEVCNGKDDDCDGMIDEWGCSP